ncbi:hypothetical protein IAR55_001427 [Kwoniella newhampshirensis]|uniref:SUN domain-containing protein n=1 Tax=Kwoniella newhampshirensis TaxID=1651941 RepID=A0AAW0Z235_9TREE
MKYLSVAITLLLTLPSLVDARAKHDLARFSSPSDRFTARPHTRHHDTSSHPTHTAPYPVPTVEHSGPVYDKRHNLRKLQLAGRTIPSAIPPPVRITTSDESWWDLVHVGEHYLLATDNTNPDTEQDFADQLTSVTATRIVVNDDARYPPQTITYPGTTPQSDVLTQCTSWALTVKPDPYWEVQVYYSDSQDLWVCQAFIRWLYYTKTHPSDWHVENGDASPVFGYEFGVEHIDTYAPPEDGYYTSM